MHVDRLSPADVTQLATDVGPVPMNVGAVLLLTGADPDAVRTALVSRLASLPRFAQRVRTAPPGLGRPYWAPTGLDLDRHVRTLRLDGRAGDPAVADVGAAEVTRRLDRSGPLWRATFVHDDTGLVGLVLVLHHVLADGIGGLAVLRVLADDGAGRPADTAPDPGPTPQPAPPTLPRLAADAWLSRTRALAALPGRLRTVRRARAELQHGDRARRRERAPMTWANGPTGPRRAVHLAEVDLAELRRGIRGTGATVNDALLVAVAGTLGAVAVERGDRLDHVVVSVPVAARTSTTGEELGNQVGVMPVRVPTAGDRSDRLRAVARETGERKRHRGASAALVGPVFRGLAALGLFRWFVDRQRLVTTFLTNLPGPRAELRLGGASVRRVVPVTVTAGNVGVAFAALSYAGRLGVTVICDPDVVPDGAHVAAVLTGELEALRDLRA